MSNKIKTSLPFCLYRVDDRVYEIKDGNNTKIRFIKEKIEPSRRTSSSQGIEFLRDRWGIDAYSRVEIETDKEFSEPNESEKAESFILKIVNDFIKIYRYLDKDAIHLISLIKEDLFDFKLEKEDGRFMLSISFGGGITPFNLDKIKEISDKIEETIKDDFRIPLWEDLILSSEHCVFTGNYRMSILESVIALELVVSDFIRKEGSKKKIPKEKIKGFIKDVGVSGNIEVTIKLLINEKESNLPNSGIFEKCKAGITIRNGIVHKGRTSVILQEAKETLEANKAMIRFLLGFE